MLTLVVTIFTMEVGFKNLIFYPKKSWWSGLNVIVLCLLVAFWLLRWLLLHIDSQIVIQAKLHLFHCELVVKWKQSRTFPRHTRH